MYYICIFKERNEPSPPNYERVALSIIKKGLILDNREERKSFVTSLLADIFPFYILSVGFDSIVYVQ